MEHRRWKASLSGTIHANGLSSLYRPFDCRHPRSQCHLNTPRLGDQVADGWQWRDHVPIHQRLCIVHESIGSSFLWRNRCRHFKYQFQVRTKQILLWQLTHPALDRTQDGTWSNKLSFPFQYKFVDTPDLGLHGPSSFSCLWECRSWQWSLKTNLQNKKIS